MNAIKKVSLELASMSETELREFYQDDDDIDLDEHKGNALAEIDSPTGQNVDEYDLINLSNANFPTITIITNEPSPQYISTVFTAFTSPIAARAGRFSKSKKEAKNSALSELARAFKEKGLSTHTYLPLGFERQEYDLKGSIDWKQLAEMIGLDTIDQKKIAEKFALEFYMQPFIREYEFNPQTQKWRGYLYANATAFSGGDSAVGLISPFVLEKEFELGGSDSELIFLQPIELTSEEYVSLLWMQRFMLLSSLGFDMWYCAWHTGEGFRKEGFYTANQRAGPPFDVKSPYFTPMNLKKPSFPLITFFETVQGVQINWALTKRVISYCNTLNQTYIGFNNNANILEDRYYDQLFKAIQGHAFNPFYFKKGMILQDIKGPFSMVAEEISQSSPSSLVINFVPLVAALKIKSYQNPYQHESGIKYLFVYPLSLDQCRSVVQMNKTVLYLKRKYMLHRFRLKFDISKEQINEKVFAYAYQPPSWILQFMQRDSLVKSDPFAFTNKSHPVGDVNIASLPKLESKYYFQGEYFELNKSVATENLNLCFPNAMILNDNFERIYGEAVLGLCCALKVFLKAKYTNIQNLNIASMKQEDETRIFRSATEAELFDCFTTLLEDQLVFKPESRLPPWEFIWRYSHHFVKKLVGSLYLKHQRQIHCIFPILYYWEMLPFSSLQVDEGTSATFNKLIAENEQVMSTLKTLEARLKYKFRNSTLLLHSLLSPDIRLGLLQNYVRQLSKQFGEANLKENSLEGEIITSKDPNALCSEIWKLVKIWDQQWCENVTNERFQFLGSHLAKLFALEMLRQEKNSQDPPPKLDDEGNVAAKENSLIN